MSTTTVCRGLRSSLEAQAAEPLTLRLTLAPNKSQSQFCQPAQVGVSPQVLDSDNKEAANSNVSTEKKTVDGEFGGWGFLESLVKDTEREKEAPYVHPLDKRSMSTLSNKSLELCTESLGCETGSDIGDDSDLYSSSSSDSESRGPPIRERSKIGPSTHKKAIPRSFPPPLTSISGSDYVQYTPHREGGRLVIRAIKITNTSTCFQAERANGRLRLRFKDCYDNSSCSEEDTDEEDEQDQDVCLNEKKSENSCNMVEGEMAIVKYQRPCSWHGNKRLLNWNPFLGVAI